MAIIIGAAIAGALCGAIPMSVGKAKNQTYLGQIGFYACVISGLMGGILLAAPVAVLFTGWILYNYQTK